MKFSELNARLLPSFATLVTSWLPSGKRMGEEWVALNPTRNDTKAGSFRINTNTGKWADFATNDNGGDPISLYAYLHGMEQKDAAESLAKSIGVEFSNDNKRAPKLSNHPKTIPAEPMLTIVPGDAAAPNTKHFKHGDASATWQYRDQAGQLLGYICRYDTADGKEILPLTWVDGKWAWKSFPKPRPLYGLDRLAANPTATVMLVEGEKAADAAQALFPQLVVLTWAGGSKAVKHADFAPLAGRKIILAPDNDEPGAAAMLDVVATLPKGCQLRWVNPPEGVDHGWDFADADPSHDWKAYIKANLSEVPGNQLANDTLPTQQPLTAGAVDTYEPLPDMTPRFKPMATIENISEICRRLNVTVRYNVISKEEELLIPGESYSVDNMANASFAWLQSWCARFNMPTEKLGDFVTYLAERNLYNPVAQWVTSKPWDGVPRLQAFCDTIKAHGEEENPVILNMKRTLMKRWMISAIAAAFQPNGVSAHGVLVLQGDQYVGKTKWFKSLVPEHLGLTQDGMMLRPDDKDSVKQAVSFWLVELGELDATFRKSDIAALKAFLTRKNDVLRRAYARKESHFARRTVFFASVNPQQFLHDPTGNRRYWTISAREIDHSHSLDMQQVWAEVLTMFNAGETYFLLSEEMDALNHSNEEFTVIDPILERLQKTYNWHSDKSGWEWKSATEILVEVGMDRPTQSDCTKAAGYIRQLNGSNAKRTNKGRFLLTPGKNPLSTW